MALAACFPERIFERSLPCFGLLISFGDDATDIFIDWLSILSQATTCHADDNSPATILLRTGTVLTGLLIFIAADQWGTWAKLGKWLDQRCQRAKPLQITDAGIAAAPEMDIEAARDATPSTGHISQAMQWCRENTGKISLTSLAALTTGYGLFYASKSALQQTDSIFMALAEHDCLPASVDKLRFWVIVSIVTDLTDSCNEIAAILSRLFERKNVLFNTIVTLGLLAMLAENAGSMFSNLLANWSAGESTLSVFVIFGLLSSIVNDVCTFFAIGEDIVLTNTATTLCRRAKPDGAKAVINPVEPTEGRTLSRVIQTICTRNVIQGAILSAVILADLYYDNSATLDANTDAARAAMNITVPATNTTAEYQYDNLPMSFTMAESLNYALTGIGAASEALQAYALIKMFNALNPQVDAFVATGKTYVNACCDRVKSGFRTVTSWFSADTGRAMAADGSDYVALGAD